MNLKIMMFVPLITATAACGGGSTADAANDQKEPAVENLVVPVLPTPTVDLYNLDDFELSGVRLGTTAAQAQQALVDFYSANIDDVKIGTVASHMPVTDYQNAEYKVNYRSDGHAVRVGLTPSLSKKDVGYMTVSRIFVESQGKTRGDKDLDVLEFYKKAREKYGPPTRSHRTEGPDFGAASWCNKYDAKKYRCDQSAAFLSINWQGITLSNPEYQAAWMEELKKWASETPDAGSLKYGSRVNNITTHVCRLYDDDNLLDCKVGEPNGDVVEIHNTTSGAKFEEFQRARVFKVVDIDQLNQGDKIGLTSSTRLSKGKENAFNIRTVGVFSFCDLVENKATTVTLECNNGSFDVEKDSVVGLQNL